MKIKFPKLSALLAVIAVACPSSSAAKKEIEGELKTPIAVLDARSELSQTVWKQELDAAPYEGYLTKLWDQMQAAENGLTVLGELPTGKVEKLNLVRSRKLPEKIFEYVHEMDTAVRSYLISSQLKRVVAKMIQDGYVLEQCRWHLASLEIDDEGIAVTKIEFALHVKGPTHSLFRRIFRGNLRVTWYQEHDEEEVARPQTVDILDLTMLRRSGVTGFNEELWLESVDASGPFEIVITEDVDVDGFVDIVFPNQNLIYRNLGDMLFDPEPIVQRRELGRVGNALFVDLNLDGKLEYVLALAGPKIYVYAVNPKTKRYDRKPITIWKGKEPILAKSLTAGDLDGDGYPELFFGQHTSGHSNGRPPKPFFDDNSGRYSLVLKNRGNLDFREYETKSLKEVRLNRRSNAASILDLNRDGQMDLLVTSDYSGLDLYENTQDGVLAYRVDEWLGGDRMYGRSHLLSDFNRDGKLDVFVAGVSSAVVRRFDNMGFRREGFEHLEAMRKQIAGGNRLYHGNGDGTFEESQASDQVALSGFTSGSSAIDFNNDGFTDIFVTNGFMSNETSKDYDSLYWRYDVYDAETVDHSLIRSIQSFVNPVSAVKAGTMAWHPFQNDNFFLNMEGEEYLNIAYLMGISRGGDGRAVVSEDFDNDGRIDMLLVERSFVELEQRVYKYENRQVSKGQWVGVDLLNKSGKSILGARVRAIGSDFESERVYALGAGYHTQPSSRIHFGLGEVEGLEALEIIWPDGSTKRLDNPELGKYHRIAP